ncbi:hypothetical protein C8034_v003973 [Colletotrichum sidae]|uniref:Uncharacterized protein n=1 Tax=Colletotrichum sidae TaxID=1347389 RepID=A0A4R8T916_9PEZI|nr:hypothetical protein C8034_v003973 [Colletotrichum sidae]
MVNEQPRREMPHTDSGSWTLTIKPFGVLGRERLGRVASDPDRLGRKPVCGGCYSVDDEPDRPMAENWPVKEVRGCTHCSTLHGTTTSSKVSSKVMSLRYLPPEGRCLPYLPEGILCTRLLAKFSSTKLITNYTQPSQRYIQTSSLTKYGVASKGWSRLASAHRLQMIGRDFVFQLLVKQRYGLLGGFVSGFLSKSMLVHAYSPTQGLLCAAESP